MYAVVAWHPDPRYHASEAVKLYKRPADAERYAAILNLPGNHGAPAAERGYVMRPVEVTA